MELFLPSLFLFVCTIAITALFVPKATPLVASLLSLAFLTYGVYHHHKLFAAEYRLATWQEGLKLYAPAVMILAVILVILYGVLSFFTSGQVPVPSLPNVSLPSANSLTNSLNTTMNSLTNSLNTTMNSLTGNGNKGNGSGNGLINSLGNSIGNSLGLNGNKGNANKNKGITRSFLETV